jgi:hypothetical protein
MHFVISVFVSICILALVILFTEVFPIWFKVVLALGGSATTGYAIALLIKKIAKETKWYTSPKVLPMFGIASACVLVVVIICTILLKKRRDKKKAAAA